MKNFIPLLLLLFILQSCSNDNVLENGVEDLAPVEIGDDAEVNMTILDNIAKKYSKNSKNPLSRSNPYAISVINGENGKPSMYVLNFADNGGWVIVSATKDYIPILAYSHEGNFNVSENTMPDGLKMWKIETLHNIKTYQEYPADSAAQFLALWREFEEQKTFAPSQKATTRAYDYPELDRIMMDSVAQWQAQGYNVYQLSEPQLTGDAQLDAEIRATAENMILPIYDYQDYSVLISKDIEYETRVDNFVLSKWDQGMYYNTYCKNSNGIQFYTGCTILSVSQVMRYFEKPEYSAEFPFNLSTMPYNYATDHTARFIGNVFDRFEDKVLDPIDYSVGSTNGETKRVIESYGYTTSISSYDTNIIKQNIAAHKPVIVSGVSGDYQSQNANGQNNTDAAHMWIISGMYQIFGSTVYKLYTFMNSNEMSNVFECENNQTSYPLHFYMSWGWNGLHDGFFVANNFRYPKNNSIVCSKVIIHNITYNN